MRGFTDDQGGSWEVVVGRESWGAFFAIFIPGEDVLGVRQSLLESSSYDAATRELEAMDAGAVLDLFLRSQPKTMG